MQPVPATKLIIRNCVVSLFIVFSAVLFLSLSGCSSSEIYKKAYPALIDGRYDSEFPYRMCSEELEKLSLSIKSINSIAYYKTYVFDPSSKIKKQNMSEELAGKLCAYSEFAESTGSGTAMVIYSQNQKIGLITCAHVINYPDTVYNMFPNPDGSQSQYVQGISFKHRQSNFIPDIPEGGEVEVLGQDSALDIAVLGRTFRDYHPQMMFPAKFAIGKARELEWGSFVYLFGYPMGYKLLTKALVSSPNRDSYGSFLLDAVFNRGFSGGIILAVRDGVPNFEWVGLVKSVPVEYDYIIRPSKEFEKHQPDKPMRYSGDLYADRQTIIKYGITKAIPVESIRAYFQKNDKFFQSKGFIFSIFTEESKGISGE